MLAATAYLLVFIILLAFVSVRAGLLAPLRETDWQGQPGWKRTAFTGVVFAGALVGWPLFVRGWFARGGRTSWGRDIGLASGVLRAVLLATVARPNDRRNPSGRLSSSENCNLAVIDAIQGRGKHSRTASEQDRSRWFAARY